MSINDDTADLVTSTGVAVTQPVVDAAGHTLWEGFTTVNEETGVSKATETLVERGDNAFKSLPDCDEEAKTNLIQQGMDQLVAGAGDSPTLKVNPDGMDEDIAVFSDKLMSVMETGTNLATESAQIGCFWDAKEAGVFQELLDNVVSSIEQYNANHTDAATTLSRVSGYYKLQEMQQARAISSLSTPGNTSAGGRKTELM